MAHPYSTSAGVQARFGKERLQILTVEHGDTDVGKVNSTVMTRYINMIDAEIDRLLGQRGLYSTPLSTVPESITDIAEEGVFLRLHERHRGIIGELKNRWDELFGVDGVLDRIGKGAEILADLGVPDGLKVTSNTTDGRERNFSRSHYDADGAKIEDEDWTGSLDAYNTTRGY